MNSDQLWGIFLTHAVQPGGNLACDLNTTATWASRNGTALVNSPRNDSSSSSTTSRLKPIPGFPCPTDIHHPWLNRRICNWRPSVGCQQPISDQANQSILSYSISFKTIDTSWSGAYMRYITQIVASAALQPYSHVINPSSERPRP